MRRRVLTSGILAALIIAASPAAGARRAGEPLCGITASPAAVRRAAGPPGGIYMPASGVVRVLLVFASFPDDESPHPFWPAHQPPSGMAGFIDPDTSTRSTGSHNLTNYFRQMSRGALQVVGDAVWIETNHSQEEYRANGSFGPANHDLLAGRGDSLIDFSAFDRWTMNQEYVQSPQSDGQVDMIVMVWRTTMWGYLGQALLAPGRPPDTLDNVRIAMGYPGYSRWDSVYHYQAGSGVTCEYPPTDTPEKAMRTMVHELAHWLIGKDHPYNTQAPTGKHEYWGMLCTSHRFSSCANTYERELLGWVTVENLPLDTTVALEDYLSSGVAYRYHVPFWDDLEYLYLENHQLLSPFDDVTLNRSDRGLWILHQDAPYNDLSDFLKVLPSDGLWNWAAPTSSPSCFGQVLPVFSRGTPAMAGLSHRDMLTTPASAVQWMFVRQDTAGNPECGAFSGGEGFQGAFSAGTARVFSPSSNPPARAWSGADLPIALEVLGDSAGVLKIQTFSNPVNASPARRYLAEDPLIDSYALGLWLAWGTQWPQGQPLEADLQSSELQRRVGKDTVWTTIYTGNAFGARDTSVRYTAAGQVAATYRVRVIDAQGKHSDWSLPFRTMITGVDAVEAEAGDLPVGIRLAQNYPNPFNPATTIRFTVGRASLAMAAPGSRPVRLAVYDLLGREVALLVDGNMPAGEHFARFDARGCASGTYICRLTAGGLSRSIRMLLVR
jgi:M6 family metalloprotease-like protein